MSLCQVPVPIWEPKMLSTKLNLLTCCACHFAIELQVPERIFEKFIPKKWKNQSVLISTIGCSQDLTKSETEFVALNKSENT